MAKKRNDRKDIRREEAQLRQARWDALSVTERRAKVCARLDARDDTDEDSILYIKEHKKLKVEETV